jgi:hypothetical protein
MKWTLITWLAGGGAELGEQAERTTKILNEINRKALRKIFNFDSPFLD